ncbi:hypothetical protein CEE37_14080 [candidate division LCP-89 bacterium B3_LCP]|uniref:Uncharacterized protein n=1 Tax=candidate division LCP-89 bacterium B3_LCP TaxID=2012998 RepID=A0A532UR08_UNCL8|nr:MAG: hypothetical protein CEE37_14080 [candidate division LCP-89 bacterium B3_LCP]
MKFQIVNSNRSEISGTIESLNLENTVAIIGGKCGIKAKKLKAVYEKRNGGSIILVILAGSRMIVEMEQIQENEETCA